MAYLIRKYLVWHFFSECAK